MEEINIKELLAYYKTRILYIILITLLVLVVGFFYKVLVEKPKYESKTTLILAGFNNTSKKDDEDAIDNNELMINQKLVTTYQQITKSEKVLSKVIKKLDLNYSIEELASHVSVASVTDTEIIKITVYDENPKNAYEIATEIADVFSAEVKSIYNVSNVSILDPARMPTKRSNMGMVKSFILFSLIGLVLGFGFVTILYYFDTTIKTTEQIEGKFDVPILGSVPDYNTTKSSKKRGSKK